MLSQLRKNMGDLKAAAQRVEHTRGDVLLRVPTLRGLGAIHIHLKSGIVERLLNAKVGETGNVAELGEKLVCLGLACIRVVAFNLNVDGRGQSKVENLRRDIGGHSAQRHGRRLADEISVNAVSDRGTEGQIG